jgi:3-deoxy-D-manno-octulosonate 8-phosphate phosphatase (KDO 8-P phosphatase)
MADKMIKEEMINKARRVKLLVLDVDGVLTDGRIIVNDSGVETKEFDVRDGHGLKLLIRCGIEVILLTGRKSAAVHWRAEDLGITEVHQGVKNKGEVFAEIITRRHISPEETACIGDDIVDIPILKRVGFSVAVADAVSEVRKNADYVTNRPGGRGAVREVCEIILKAQNLWGDIAAKYEFDA